MLRRTLSLIPIVIVLLISALVQPPLAKATTTTTYVWSFDRQQWLTASGVTKTSLANANVELYAGTFSFQSPGYPVFLYLSFTAKATLNVSFTQDMKIVISTPSATILNKTINFLVTSSLTSHTYRIPIFNPPYTNQVKVTITLKQTGSFVNSALVNLNLLRILIVGDKGYSFNTSLDLATPPSVPRGKDGVGLALSLNKTELIFSTPETVATGSIGLQLLWNGGYVNITPWLAINNSGNIYMKFGNEKYVSTIPLNKSQWTDVYIGWEPGTAYIAIGNVIMTFSSFNWTVPLRSLGSASQNANLLLDTVVISTNYLPPSSLQILMGLNDYHILWKSKTITISPEGLVGQLGTLSVSFLNANLSSIGTAILSPEIPSITAPNTTRYLIISANGVSRMYTLPATEITFPSLNQQVIIAKIGVTPGTWQSVIVKTPNGKIAYSGPLQDNAFQFSAVQGATYLITFRSGNVSVTRVTQVTGDTVFYVGRVSSVIKPPISISASYKDGILKVEYYDAQNTTKELNITVAVYSNFEITHAFTYLELGPFGYYRFVIPVNKTADYAKVYIKALINGTWQEWERTVIINQVGGKSPFPSNLVPPAFIVLGSALLPFFLARGTEPWLMLIGGAVGLTFTMLMGWIPATPVIKMLAAALTVLGVFAMLARRW